MRQRVNMSDASTERNEVTVGALTRGVFLKKGVGSVVVVSSLGSVLAACGGDEPTTQGDGEQAGAAAKKTGKLAPFDPGAPAGTAPKLPKRIASAVTSNAEFFLALDKAVKAGAQSRGLDFLTATNDADPEKFQRQAESFLARGIGAFWVNVFNIDAQRGVMQAAIDKGVAVFVGNDGPSTSQIGADQYTVGRAQGDMAAEYIKRSLGGKAEVVDFHFDSLFPQIKARHRGVLDGLKTAGPGVTIYSIEAESPDQDGAFKAMTTELQAHPGIKVVVGGDVMCLGAMSAARSAGKLQDDWYFGGVDGDVSALAEIRKGGPYRASLAFGYEIVGYAYGRLAADWLEGKSIPKFATVDPVRLTNAAEITAFRADMDDPASAMQDPKKVSSYMTFFGNIKYDERGEYLKSQYKA